LENFVVLKKFKKVFKAQRKQPEKGKRLSGVLLQKKAFLDLKMDSFTVLQKLPM
jgi:hypothetical protein